MDQYAGLAEIYDKTIEVDYDRWAQFVKDYLQSKKIGLKGKSVLELGCGTGNMTLKLKELGAEITAMDISQEMLTVAEEKTWNKRYKIRYLNQNMTSFNIQKKFGIVSSFCDGYNYVVEEDDIRSSFRRVFNHLENGGCFIFDISTPHKLKNIMGNNTFTMNEKNISYIWDNYVEGDRIEMYITFFIKENKLYRRLEEHHIQKIHTVERLQGILEETGFKNIEIYDDYSFNEISDESMRATFIAFKEE